MNLYILVNKTATKVKYVSQNHRQIRIDCHTNTRAHICTYIFNLTRQNHCISEINNFINYIHVHADLYSCMCIHMCDVGGNCSDSVLTVLLNGLRRYKLKNFDEIPPTILIAHFHIFQFLYLQLDMHIIRWFYRPIMLNRGVVANKLYNKITRVGRIH